MFDSNQKIPFIEFISNPKLLSLVFGFSVLVVFDVILSDLDPSKCHVCVSDTFSLVYSGLNMVELRNKMFFSLRSFKVYLISSFKQSPSCSQFLLISHHSHSAEVVCF